MLNPVQHPSYLPDERLDATGTTIDLVEGHLTKDLVTMLPVDCKEIPSAMLSRLLNASILLLGCEHYILSELLDLLNLLWYLGGEGLLEGLYVKSHLLVTKPSCMQVYSVLELSTHRGFGRVLSDSIATSSLDNWLGSHGGGSESSAP